MTPSSAVELALLCISSPDAPTRLHSQTLLSAHLSQSPHQVAQLYDHADLSVLTYLKHYSLQVITTLPFKEYNTLRILSLLSSPLGLKEKKYAQEILFLAIRREYSKDRGTYTALI